MATTTQAPIVFVGDEITALGFRLAGVATRVPGEDDLASVLAEARDGGACVIVTAELFARLPELAHDDALLVIESARAQVPPPDFAARVRRVLGISP